MESGAAVVLGGDWIESRIRHPSSGFSEKLGRLFRSYPDTSLFSIKKAENQQYFKVVSVSAKFR